MSIRRMDNVGIVVSDLQQAVKFFQALGMRLDGRAHIEGTWADQTVGLTGIRSEIAVLSTPDGHSKVELLEYLQPPAVQTPPAGQNTIGTHRIMFTVADIEESLDAVGAQPLGEVATYKDSYRLCYIKGPSGIIVALAQELT